MDAKPVSTLDLLKANLGITTTSRDAYLQSILDSVTKELIDEKGIPVAADDDVAQMFVIDYAAWRYRNRGEGIMPRNIQYRLHNLMVHTKKGGGADADVGH